MLQPSASPSHYYHQAPAVAGGDSQEPVSPATSQLSSQRAGAKGIWQWVTSKELLFVFVACCLGVFLFRTKDSFQLLPVWKEVLDKSHFANNEFPHNDEKL